MSVLVAGLLQRQVERRVLSYRGVTLSFPTTSASGHPECSLCTEVPAEGKVRCPGKGACSNVFEW